MFTDSFKMAKIFGKALMADVSLALQMKNTQLQTLCKISLQFCQKGDSKSLITKYAAEFQCSPENLSRCAKGLSKLFIIAAKQRMTGSSLQNIVSSVVKSKENISLCTEFYAENLEKIQACLQHMVIHLPSYRDLDWRLDMELSSRTLHNRMEPHFIAKLETLDAGTSGATTQQFLEIDYAHLKMLCATLEEALEENSSVHVKRMQRYIS